MTFVQPITVRLIDPRSTPFALRQKVNLYSDNKDFLTIANVRLMKKSIDRYLRAVRDFEAGKLREDSDRYINAKIKLEGAKQSTRINWVLVRQIL